MKDRAGALAIGLVLGIAGTLLVSHVSGQGENVAEQLEAALRCDDGPINQTAAIAHHTAGYSLWASTHAERLYGIGCDAGPATILLEFSPYGSDLEHALATMRGFGAVCVVHHGVFEGRSLGSQLLRELCSDVGGQIRVV
jgi:hypothetical protein